MTNHRLIVCLCAGLGAAMLPAQEGGRTTTLRSLRPFLRADSQQNEPLRCSLLAANFDDQGRNLVRGHADDNEELDLVDLLTALHGAEHDADRLSWSVLQSNLLLFGEAALVANCNKELDRLAASFARPIAVTAWILPATGADLPSVLGPDQLAALLKSQLPQWTQTTRTQPFCRVSLGNERWTNYVRDVDVEVAQKAQIGDPKLDVLFDGLRLSCTAEPLPDGDQLVLDIALAYGEKIDVRTVPTGVQDQPDIELPELHTALAQGSARIQNGGAAVLQLRSLKGAGPNCRVVLSARFLAPPAAPVSNELLVLPVGALVQPVPAPRLPALPPVPENDNHFPEYRPAQSSESDPEYLSEYLTRAADPDLDYTPHAGFLVLKATAAQQDRVVAALRQLVDARLVNLELQAETRCAVVESSTGVLPTAAGAAATSLWRIVLPVLACRPGSAFVGTEFAVISDFEVEIAQSSAVNNPVETIRQSGLWTAAWLQFEGQRVYADWMNQVASQGPPRLHPLGGKPGGQVGLVDTRLAAFPLHGEVEPGQEIDLGDGPIAAVGEQRFATRQFVKLVRR